MNNQDERCFLIDGSSFFYRAFHALPPLVNSKNQATGAIYGVASMLKKLLSQFQPAYVTVIFDKPGKTFRDELYPAYKAHRPPTPPELKSQYPILIDLIQAMGIPVFAVPGVEADDVIGSLAKQAEQQNISSVLVTSDKDFAQLVNPHIQIYDSMSNQWLDTAAIIQKYGVHPEQFQDYLCLMGDNSDNIPGVHKCGPKTASKWLQTYGDLENIIAHAAEITGKIGEYLRQAQDFFKISKQLVTIHCTLELPIQISDLKQQPPDEEKIYQLAQELEFKTWLKPKNSEVPASTKTNVQIINTITALQTWIAQIHTETLLVVDTETSNLDPLQAQLIGVSLCTNQNNACYIPLAHQSGTNCDWEPTISLLKPLLENPTIRKVGQNLKYDAHIFSHIGIHLQGIYADTMLESYVHHSTATRHDLASLAKHYLQLDSIAYTDLTGKGNKQIPFAAVEIPKAAEYSGEDVILTYQLHQYFQSQLSTQEQLILNTIEIPTSIVLTAMEEQGICVDCTLLKNQGEILKQKIKHLETQAWEIAGQTFNLQSPKQLAEILYEKMQIPIISKTPSGQASTAEEVLQTLALDYPLPAILIEHRRLSKLVSTYIEGLPKWVNPHTGRIHTSYNQAIASTGRLSSTAPNLQNIPAKTEEGRLIRKAFISKPGYSLLTADYSQIELRIMAHFSKDPGLLNAFHHHLDIHQATAAEIFNIPIQHVNKEQRRQAKTINFGLIYGMSAFGLAKQLKIPRQAAQDYIERYFHHYPSIQNYMEQVKSFAHTHGFVETLDGRRLYLPEIHHKNISKVKAAERIAINAPLQGTAADLLKKSMIQIYAWLQEHSQIRAKILLQVHDELVFEVHDQDIDIFFPVIQHHMENVASLDVPLIVNLGRGKNWEEAH